ncbi:MAG: DNA polymerase V subunit UmuC, partial [Spirochaetia bacterium]|nr:DNA polymerase V subunit UmuC [Spirochaetia bacterium]
MEKKETLIALVDCNSFYASCEKLFRPDLENRPVVVLSNNDSCIVAASAEAKKAGLKRGLPLFQQKQLIDSCKAAVFSSNYTLYADISRRVIMALGELAPSIEAYSID